jgi:hypothetical protein
MKQSGIRETTPKIPNNHLGGVDQIEKGISFRHTWGIEGLPYLPG